MPYPSSGNHWGIFLILILLLLGHPRSYEGRLVQLTSVIDATRNSLRSLNEGVDTLQAGIQQPSYHAPAALTEPDSPATETQTPDPGAMEEEEIITANMSLV